MSVPAVTAHTVEPVSSASHMGSPLDTGVEEIAVALTQIEAALLDTMTEINRETQCADEVPTRTSRASFCHLPSEILLTIFKHACQVGENWEALSFSLVCKQWRALMLVDPDLWSHITLTVRDLFPNPTPSSSVSTLLRMAKLTSLYLERSVDCMLSVTIRMPTRFRGLNANWQSYVSVGAINYLQSNSRRIKHLRLRVDHGLLHAFAYVDPCLAEIDSGHNQPCSDTISLPHLVSLSLEYVSRHCFYFPFQHIPRLRHLTLGNEGFCFFPKSSSEPSPALTFPKLRSLVVSEASSLQQLCRTMTLINVLPHIKQLVLTQMPRLGDLPTSRQQAIFPVISKLKIANSSDFFLSTFCRVFQFSALEAFELIYDVAGQSSSSSRISWTNLVCDIVYFIRRCPMIRSVTVRNAREHCYPSAELVREITVEPRISPNVCIVGFPRLEIEGELTAASAMMEFLQRSEVQAGSFPNR
ncbi:hypothetical protein EV359DRAFT_61484 [Lentinula novae-zelandiae]|nr:hypothetical protein EV359DRAFT_61484 [Lentinula novae-zelandiae]